MPKDASEVIEGIFAAGEADEETAAVTPALRALWEARNWSEQAIEAAALAGGDSGEAAAP